MDKLIRRPGVQFIVAFVAAVLAGWVAFHLGEQHELADVIRTSPYDGQAGMDILAAGFVAWVVTFFGVLLLVLILLRTFKKPSK